MKAGNDSDGDSFDDLINDLNNVMDKQPIQQPQQVTLPKQNTKKKCVTPIIGNSQRACQNLRCTKCDLKVNCHQNKRWNQDATYLVFRNYFNNPQMLSKYQIDDQSCNAYNCQCHNINAAEQQQSPQQWVCAGHS